MVMGCGIILQTETLKKGWTLKSMMLEGCARYHPGLRWALASREASRDLLIKTLSS